jgi:AI-2 transport protein TqsA
VKDQPHNLFTPSLQNVAYGLVILVIVGIIFKELASLLQPFFIAVFIYFISMPVVRWLRHHKVPSPLAHLITILLITGIFVGFAWTMGAHIDEASRKLPQLTAKIRRLSQNFIRGVSEDFPALGKQLKETSKPPDLAKAVDSTLDPSLDHLMNFLSALLLMVFYLVVIFYEKKRLPMRLEHIYGRARAQQIQDVGARINDSIVKYIYVKFLASLLTAVLAIGVMLIFRLDSLFRQFHSIYRVHCRLLVSAGLLFAPI